MLMSSKVAKPHFKCLALIGVGLIGGSAAQAWRQAGCVDQVVGYDVNDHACSKALELGVVDRAASRLEDALQTADLVLLAVPVGSMQQVMQVVAQAAAPAALVTDVGSTKGSVIAAARAELVASSSFPLSRFVPAHPIAGRERPGVEHADAELFRHKLVVATPLPETQADALAQVEALWSAAGAQITRMSPEEHDQIFAAVSHLPHLLAFALVASIASEPEGDRKLSFAGAGFRDFTRIAASSPIMWRDILLANRSAVSSQLQRYRSLLDALQVAVDSADAGSLERVFELASRTRREQARQFDAE